MFKYRNLLIHGVNAALAEGIRLLDPDTAAGHTFANVAGAPSVILWSAAFRKSRRISLWWDYDHACNPFAALNGTHREQFAYSLPMPRRSDYPSFLGAMVTGHLTLTGRPHLLGYGKAGITDLYLKATLRDAVEGLLVSAPQGFAAEGPLVV